MTGVVHSRWEWAGIAVRDEQGNLIVMEMDNPAGTVIASHTYERVRDWSGRIVGVRSQPDIQLSVHLEGLAHEWDGRVSKYPRSPQETGEQVMHAAMRQVRDELALRELANQHRDEVIEGSGVAIEPKDFSGGLATHPPLPVESEEE